MNAQRILKEASPLLWPWCVVMVAGMVPFITPLKSLDWVGPVGFVLGIPLLATLPFGNEFQHRTFSLLLAQPVDRMQIWRDKIRVTLVVVSSAILVFCLWFLVPSFQPDPNELAFVAAWVAATLASATFWTLFARSIVGGFVLNVAMPCLIYFVVSMASWLGRPTADIPTHGALMMTTCFLVYAGVMLWLGRRALMRFQATGGMGGDLLTAGPDVISRALTGWLRCRPSGAVLNLFRKEIYLLRPVWLISIVTLLGWACLPLLKSRPLHGAASYLEFAGVSLGAISTLMIAILAGTISVGEERTSGMHAWHITLPIPALLQWRIKLYVALLASFLGAWLLPVFITRNLRSPDDKYMGIGLTTAWLLGVLILTFASFCCACAVKGTVRAALLVLPALIVLSLASVFGIETGGKFADFMVSKFDPFANFRFTDTIVSMVFPRSSLSFLLGRSYYNENSTQVLLALSIPTLILALLLSYRLFCNQVRDGALSLFRNLLPLAVVAFLSTFAFLFTVTFVWDAWQQDWEVFNEARGAIVEIHSRSPKPDGSHPVHLKLDDLARVYPLSETTRRWLHGSSITIVPLKGPPSRYGESGDSIFRPWWPNDRRPWYLTTILLPGGTHCAESYPSWNRTFNMFFVICK